MASSTQALPDTCRQWVDRINQALAAEDFDHALYLSFQYFRARAANCHKRRPQDADGFKRQAVSALADLAGKIHGNHPLDKYRFVNPMVSGGDWQPES